MYEFLIALVENEKRKFLANKGSYTAESNEFDNHLGGEPTDPYERTNFFIAKAIKLIISSNLTPTRAVPLIINGREAEGAKYMWTAIVLLGAIGPDKFSYEFVKSWVYGFEPKTELAVFPSLYSLPFGGASLYETSFKRFIHEDRIKYYLANSNAAFARAREEEIAAERARQEARAEAERRAEALEAERRRNAEREAAEQRRLAEHEAEQKRLADLAAEKSRLEKLKTPEQRAVEARQAAEREAELKRQAEAAAARQAEIAAKERAVAEKVKAEKIESLSIRLHTCVDSFETSNTRNIKFLLNEGADINFKHGSAGYTVLMAALDRDNHRIAEYLLRNGANPLIRNNYGEIARNLVPKDSPIASLLLGYELIQCLRNGDAVTLKATLAQGADIDFRHGDEGHTPLLLAVQENKPSIVSLLLSQGADPTLTLYDGRDIFALISSEAVRTVLNDLIKSAEEMSEDDSDEEEAGSASDEGPSIAEAKARSAPTTGSESGGADAKKLMHMGTFAVRSTATAAPAPTSTGVTPASGGRAATGAGDTFPGARAAAIAAASAKKDPHEGDFSDFDGPEGGM